jgi:hypothetical protein
MPSHLKYNTNPFVFNMKNKKIETVFLRKKIPSSSLFVKEGIFYN